MHVCIGGRHIGAGTDRLRERKHVLEERRCEGEYDFVHMEVDLVG